MRVLIVDDHEVVRRGVRSLLLGQTSYELCGEAVDGQDALVKARALKPDVIVMDVSMPNLNGLECTRLMRNILPDCEILILSQHESPEMARQALNAGARGYVAKRSIAKDLISALDKVSRHECFFDPAIWDTASSPGHLDIQEILQRSAAFEQALRESEQLYRSTFELAAVGVAHVKPDGRWLRVNKKLCEIVGYTEAELMQLTFQEITHPEDLPTDLAETEKLLNGLLDVISMKKRYIRKDGSPVWVNLTSSAARDAGGKVKHFITVVEDIHERRESDAAQARLAAIVESSDDAIISKDLDGVIRSWNVGAIRTFEYTAQEAIGRSITIIIPPERQDEEAQILQRLRKGERIEHFETVRVTKSGKKIDVSLTISPVRNSNGQVIGVSTIARDVTAQKQVEGELRESEERFRAILETTPECVKLVAQDGTLLHMNASGLKMVGADCADLVIGQSVYDLIALEDRDRFRAFNEKICGGEKGGLEFDIVALDGQRRQMETHSAPLRNPDGTLVHLGVTRDITMRKQVEKSTNLLAAIVDSSDDAIISKSLDGVITSWNRSAERIFGYSAQEAIGQHITLIIPEDRREEETAIIARLRKGERIEHFDTVRVRKDGGLLHLSLTISPVRDDSGNIVGASKVARDITERKQAEERERQITAEAIAATAKFRAVFEQTTVFAGIMSKDGTLIEANRLCLEVCGYRAEDAIGKPFWEGGWWRNFVESRDKIRDATPLVAQGTPYRETLHYSWADDTERLVDFALYPILDDKGEVLYLHPTGVDITDIKRAEENYRNLAKRLDAEVQARTEELEDRNADVLRQSEQVRKLSLRLMITQDEERRHIARDLHDSAGQTLTVLGINLAQLIHNAERIAPDLAKEGLKIQEHVQQLHREIRTTSYLLHPPLLDETGLPSALSWYVQGLSERSGLKIDLSIEEGFERLPADMEMAVFRLVQESLTNVHRHSGSKSACIRIAREGENVCVEVSDQGHGIPPHRMADIKSHGSGLGLRGLRERLRQFGGEMNIESNGTGARVLAKIPLPKETRPADADPLQAAAIR